MGASESTPPPNVLRAKGVEKEEEVLTSFVVIFKNSQTFLTFWTVYILFTHELNPI
jgi:hypothetical protein